MNEGWDKIPMPYAGPPAKEPPFWFYLIILVVVISCIVIFPYAREFWINPDKNTTVVLTEGNTYQFSKEGCETPVSFRVQTIRDRTVILDYTDEEGTKTLYTGEMRLTLCDTTGYIALTWSIDDNKKQALLRVHPGYKIEIVN